MKAIASVLNVGLLLLLGYLLVRDGPPANLLEWLALVLALSAPIASLAVFCIPAKK
jgi:hypothetical protein